ncbi:class I SAM-dependent methyltransferase [Deinococcus sp. AB2017081]|nr:class I SAM-dependent methyltransferase [Deinococcus sp. AB2017081]WQE93674.1 class I SAM-dependent methyltransferase [Deinococcus sp. AB2017081]
MTCMDGPAQRKENLNLPAPAMTVAQRSNLSPMTARAYTAWRRRSLSLLAGQPFDLAREERLFLTQCAPQRGGWWLDAGTSTGFYAEVLARAGCRVLAADLSPAMLAEAARQHPHPGIDWAALNVEDSALPDASFDGVTVGATLNETHDPARFLRGVARVLRPGGQVWLMYLRRTGGPVQGVLAHPAAGGLTFPDPAWVARQLPGLHLAHGLTVGAVRFERHVKTTAGRHTAS